MIVRIAPLRRLNISKMGGTQTIFQFEDAAPSEIVYVEQRTDAAYIGQQAAVNDYRISFDRLTNDSLPRAETIPTLKRHCDDYA